MTKIKTTELINSEDHQIKEGNKICKETAQLCCLNLCYFSMSHRQNATAIHNTELILIFCSLYTYIPRLGELGFISILSKCFHHKKSIQKPDWLELNTEFTERKKQRSTNVWKKSRCAFQKENYVDPQNIREYSVFYMYLLPNSVSTGGNNKYFLKFHFHPCSNLRNLLMDRKCWLIVMWLRSTLLYNHFTWVQIKILSPKRNDFSLFSLSEIEYLV